MRVRINTTINAELWQALRLEAVKQQTDCSVILDKLIADYLKGQKKGGRR